MLFIAILAGTLLFIACSDSSTSPETPSTDFTVTIDVDTTKGEITANTLKGPDGTEVKLTVTAKTGYMYKQGSLRFKDNANTPIPDTGETAFRFTLSKDVTVTADFEDRPANVFSVTVAPTVNGTITAYPIDAQSGDNITLLIIPATGYILDTLTFTPQDGSPQNITGNTFAMPAKNVTVTGTFKVAANANEFLNAGIKALNEGNYDMAISNFESAYTMEQNSETILYSSLGKLASIAKDQKVKDFMKDRMGIKNYPGTISSLITPDWLEVYTEEQLIWWYRDNDDNYNNWYDKNDSWFFSYYGITPKSGYYKRRELNPQMMTLGETARRQGKLDSYLDDELNEYVYWRNYDPNTSWPYSGNAGYYYYEYDTYTYTFVTSEPKIGDLSSYYDSSSRFYYWYDTASSYTGFSVPGYYWVQSYAYDLVSETPQYEYYTSRFPGLDVPSWFGNTDAYKDSFTTTNLQSTATYGILMFANLVDKNTNGLNTLFDELLSGAFGADFEAAYTRAGTITENVTLKSSTLEAFGLSDIFEGGDVSIGKAELNLLFAALRFIKASLEWINAYDWNTDLNFLKNGQLWDDWSKLGNNIPANLPLRNNFLKDRNNGNFTKSKADFIKAIDDSIAAYDLWIGDNSNLPQGYKDTLNDYKWVRDGFDKLKTAINQGQTFYVKETSGNTYSNTSTDAMFGIDFDKFFTAGQLSIVNLLDNEEVAGKGKAPVFYGYNSSTDSWVKITDKTQISSYATIGFKLTFTPVKQVIVAGAENMSDEVEIKLLSSDYAVYIWDWYHN